MAEPADVERTGGSGNRSGRRLAGRIADYARMILFTHTVFSLPFLLLGMTMAAGGGFPAPRTVFWILAAFLGARNGANALNRIIDREIDARNPRTAGRHLPAGSVGTGEAWAVALVFLGLLVVAAFMLRPLCVALLPLAGLLLWGYSYTKRFTPASHLVLGAASAAAPVGAWIAAGGGISVVPLVLAAANTLYVAGFDIIYATQDAGHDRREGLRSIPADFGVPAALRISSLFHVLTLVLLAALPLITPLGGIFGAGTAAVAVLMFVEHRSVSPDDLQRVTIASYGINQIISLVLLAAALADILLS